MGVDNSEFSPQPAPINFHEIAHTFAAHAVGSPEVNENHLAKVAKGMKKADESLRNSTGEILLIQYRNREQVISGVARTNRKGLKISQDAEGRDQIEFGENAVLLTTTFGDNKNTITRSASLVVPQGFALEFFGDSRDFLIGTESIKEYMQDIEGRNVSQVAEKAFLLEQIGIDTDTFFTHYHQVSPRITSAYRRQQIYDAIKKGIAALHQAYGFSSESPGTQTEIDQLVRVDRISLWDGSIKLVFGDRSVMDIDEAIDPDPLVVSLEKVKEAIKERIGKQDTYLVWWDGFDMEEGSLPSAVNGVDVRFATNGILTDPYGTEIGNYIRLDEEESEEQNIIVFLNKD